MSPTAAIAAGAVCISSTAVLMRLADTSASLAALGRCAFALPVLGALAWLERRPRNGRPGAPPMPSRRRWLARLAGVVLAADLIVWNHTIADIGAGLSTVVGNLEVLIIAVLAWLVLGERPRRSLVLASPVMLAGLVLVGGLADGAGSHAYGADPRLGVVLGVGVALLYAIYILMLRQATSSPAAGAAPAAVAAPLFEATVGAVAGSVVLGLALGDFTHGLGPAGWATFGWLALLALTSQVIGWLLITVAMPRLAAGMIGALLLIQPAGSVVLSYLFLGERPSALQLTGVALMLAGVVIAVSGRAPAVPYSRRRTRIIRQASTASSGRSAPKSP
ncbi:MAG TPA: DMT family transporter [Streptosporangiaceae bacterium]|jgi:drug/metabolite transporter (DMT)-like permease